MTAPAVAAPAGPAALPASRTAPQPATDRFAFAALLDSLPGAAAKVSSSAAEEGSRTSNNARQDEAPPGQPNSHPLPDDSALLSGLPFALASALATNEPKAAAAGPPTSTKGASLEASGASAAPSVEAAKPAAARLTGERAFHFALATSSFVGGGPPSIDAPSFAAPPVGSESAKGALAPSSFSRLPIQARGLTLGAPTSGVSASPADAPASPGAAPPASKTPAAGEALAPAAPGAGPPANPTGSPMRAAAQDPARGGRKAEAAPAPSAPRAASPAAPSAKAESGDKAAQDGPPDPAASAGQSTPQGSAFGQPPAPSGAAGPSFGLFDAAAVAGDAPPRTGAPAAAPTSAAPPVKEIDVDLSPTGLEDVSMTMRLSGDKLSVVFRAASSQTAGSIEGARDAIADRLAAIGQPLDSLIVRQTGANADANANGYGASTDEGSTSSESRAGPNAGGQGGSGDADSSRRGSARNRGF